MIGKPRIFIGSSSEGLNIANACNVGLDHTAEVSPWTNAFDRGSSDILSSLITKAENVDFALFVFSSDDITTMRNETKRAVRDNIIFELGLFIGSIGKERCFILRPRNQELYIPSDLAGINTYDFDPYRDDTNMNNAVNAACVRLSAQMLDLGRINKPTVQDKILAPNVTNREYALKNSQLRILSEFISTQTTNVDGMYFWDLEQKRLPYSETQLHMGIIQLTRVGFIEKKIIEEEQGGSHYTFQITNSGIEYLLSNEDKLAEIIKVENDEKQIQYYQRPPQQPTSGF